MKPRLALSLLFVASLTASCAAQPEPLPDGHAARPTEPATHAPIVLGDKEGRVRLTFPIGGIGMRGVGAVQLRAFDEILLGAGETPEAAGNAHRAERDSLCLDGQVVRATGTNLPRPVERRSSKEWEYASADLVNGYGPGLKQFKRHLLYVQPDLFVICDEICLVQPAAISTGLWFPENLWFDSARGEWRVQLTNAGLAVRLFGSPRSAWRSWLDSGAADSDGGKDSGLKCLRAGVTNKIIELRQITVLALHEKDKRRSLAFKLLESETAIGVRVHRDGLPTLIAFRKSIVAGEADLTGMKFAGPVAVDVFQPKRKQATAAH